MSQTPLRFLQPLDVLIFRGNKLFGEAGSYGESLMPPWPSVAAGALRSRMLVDKKIDINRFASGALPPDPALGTPQGPGPFSLSIFQLAWQKPDGELDALYPPPADLVFTTPNDPTQSEVAIEHLTPVPPPAGLKTSYPLPYLPVLAQSERRKPVAGRWLDSTAWKSYLAGDLPSPDHCVAVHKLWSLDHRVGVGLNPKTGSVDEGRLFSLQAIALRPNVGFLTAADGAELPTEGVVRLGGDGRAAAIREVTLPLPKPDFASLVEAGRFRLILTTPGIFEHGWIPNGVHRVGAHEWKLDLCSVTARLCSATTPRFDVVSGWDLANNQQPKRALRAAPVGSVYWFDHVKGDANALQSFVRNGLWSNPPQDPHRRAEGFNRFTLANWR